MCTVVVAPLYPQCQMSVLKNGLNFIISAVFIVEYGEGNYDLPDTSSDCSAICESDEGI